MPDHATRAPAHAVIASTDVVVRQGIRAILAIAVPGLPVTEAGTLRGAAAATARLRPAVLLLDSEQALGDTLAVLPGLARDTRVVLILHRGCEQYAPIALRRGAGKVLSFDDVTEQELAESVRVATERADGAGEARIVRLPAQRTRRTAPPPPARSHDRVIELFARIPGPAADDDLARLSPREAEVISQMALGLRNRDIAQTLWMSEKTVKNHINRIFAKLHVDTRAQAILRWLAIPRPESSQAIG